MKFSRDNDVDIWRKFKQGDNEAFSAIYRCYSSKLYLYGLKITRNHTLVEDALQDLFLELIRNRKSIGETNNVLGYLLTSFRRKLFRKIKSEYRYDLVDEAPEYPFDVMYSVEHEMLLDESRNRRNALFIDALKQLSPRQKEAIYLRFTNGLAYEEVSGIMEMSLEACRNLIYRAIKSLKEGLKSR